MAPYKINRLHSYRILFQVVGNTETFLCGGRSEEGLIYPVFHKQTYKFLLFKLKSVTFAMKIFINYFRVNKISLRMY